jgi:hypothetical protein
MTMARFTLLKNKIAYVVRRWPGVKGNPDAITLTIWREFYPDAFDGVAEAPVDASEWTTTARRMIGLPSRDEVAKIINRAAKAAAKRELERQPPAPWYATRD